MSAQPNTPSVQVLPAAKNNVMAALNPILKNGELDFKSLDFSGRLEAFQAFKENSNVNLILLEQNILSQFPQGVSLIPIPIVPDKSDAWAMEKIIGNKPDAQGRVEPSAEFFLKIAASLNIKLTEVFSGVVEDACVAMYRVRYNAYIILPNGEPLGVENEGKDMPLLTSSGTVQAHIVESVRKKAKRNAIKALLNIPTTMDKADFERPWILFRPVFRAESEEAKAIIANNKALAAEAAARLYGKPIMALASSGANFETIKKALDDAKTEEELASWKKRVSSSGLTADEKLSLQPAFKAKIALFQTGEVVTETKF